MLIRMNFKFDELDERVQKLLNKVNSLTDKYYTSLINDPYWVVCNYQRILALPAEFGTEWFKYKELTEKEEHDLEFIKYTCLNDLIDAEYINDYLANYGPNLALTTILLISLIPNEVYKRTALLALLAMHYNTKIFTKKPELITMWLGVEGASSVYALLRTITFGLHRDDIKRIKKVLKEEQDKRLKYRL